MLRLLLTVLVSSSAEVLPIKEKKGSALQTELPVDKANL